MKTAIELGGALTNFKKGSRLTTLEFIGSESNNSDFDWIKYNTKTFEFWINGDSVSYLTRKELLKVRNNIDDVLKKAEGKKIGVEIPQTTPIIEVVFPPSFSEKKDLLNGLEKSLNLPKADSVVYSRAKKLITAFGCPKYEVTGRNHNFVELIYKKDKENLVWIQVNEKNYKFMIFDGGNPAELIETAGIMGFYSDVKKFLKKNF